MFLTSTLFLETLTAGLAFVFFVIVAREYYRRRQPHLAFVGVAALFLSLSYGASFLGQVARGFIGAGIGDVLVFSYQIGITVAGAFVWLAVIWLYLPPTSRRWLTAAVALAAAASLTLTVRGGTGVQPVFGYFVVTPGTLSYWVSLAFTASAAFALVLVGAVRDPATGIVAGPERYLASAGAFTLAARALLMAAALTGHAWMLPAAMVLRVGTVICAGLGAVAKNNMDRRIARDPMRFFGQRLLYKAVGLNLLLYWLLSFLLVFLTSSYFIAQSVEQRRDEVRKDVHYFAVTREEANDKLLAATTQLALQPVRGLRPASTGALPPAFAAFAGDDRGLVVRIVDDAGKVVASSLGAYDLGASLLSPVTRLALGGEAGVAMTDDPQMEQWLLRAAAPLTLEDGTRSGAVVVDDPGTTFDFGEYAAVAPVAASGYGFVSENGTPVFLSGDALEESERIGAVAALHGRDTAFMRLTDDDEAVFERVGAGPKRTDGFFFALIGQSLVASYAFRIMTVATLVMHLALAAVLALLVYSTSRTLRPIKDLRKAIVRIEAEKYGARIAHTSYDEVGELADTFNRMSEIIEERERRLKAAVELEHDFLEHSVKDIRTPVNRFRWLLELLRFGGAGPVNAQQKEMLDQMHDTNERLSRLVLSLDDVARLDQGTYKVAVRELPPEPLIDAAAAAVAARFAERKIAFGWKQPDQPLPAVSADPEALAKILTALLINAAKFNAEQGHVDVVASKTDHDVPGGRQGRYLRITVSDGGRGIPADEQGTVFSKFFRASNVKSEEHEGSGLGLHVAKRLAMLMGGNMWFTSKEGVGTAFTVTVPLGARREVELTPEEEGW